MAGEFANSLGLTFAVVFFGVAGPVWRPVGIEAAAARLRLPDSLISSPPSSRSCVCWRCGSSGRVCARPPGSLSSAHWPACSRRSGCSRSEPVVAQRHGWGKERRYVAALWDRSGSFGDQTFLANDPPLQVLIVLAVIGAVLCGVRRVRFGMAMTMVAVAFAALFLLLPEGRL